MQSTFRFGARTLLKFVTAIAIVLAIVGLIARNRARYWAIESIKEGMTEKEVLQIAGEPDWVERRDDDGTSMWYYGRLPGSNLMFGFDASGKLDGIAAD